MKLHDCTPHVAGDLLDLIEAWERVQPIDQHESPEEVAERMKPIIRELEARRLEVTTPRKYGTGRRSKRPVR